MQTLSRSFFDRPAPDVAPELLNKVLVCRDRGGRIVEVEAYTPDDPASHSYRGRTRRTATMFGPPGHLYVYLIYGMHWCANAVCDADGVGAAVLIRALAPMLGLEAMRAGRPAARRDRDLCSGPAKLCQALGITGDHDGYDLVAGAAGDSRGIRICDDDTPPPARPGQSRRIGLSRGALTPWRWVVPGEPNLSRPG